jgi:hypothetical protein
MAQGNAWRFIAIFLVQLLILTSVAVAQQAGGGTSATSGAVSVRIDAPTVTNRFRVDMNISATAGSELRIFVDDDLKRRVPQVAANGNFFAAAIPLGLGVNVVRVEASLGGDTAKATKEITVDNSAPDLQLTIPETAPIAPVTVTGTSNKPMQLQIRITQGDETPPRAVTGVTKNESADSIRINWDASAATDLRGYAVFRDGKMVETLSFPDDESPVFTDTRVGSDTAYNYGVAAVDTACKVGPQTSIGAKALPGSSIEAEFDPASLDNLGCGFQTQSIAAGNVSVVLNVVEEVINHVEIIGTDLAGNVVRLQGDVFVDSDAPEFLTNTVNLDRVSPTFDPFITLRGDVSEPSAVTVIIGGKPVKTVNTDAFGHFSADITLPGNLAQPRLNASAGPTSIEADFGTGQEFQVSLVATDSAGNTATIGPEPVVYALCGQGNDYDVFIGEPIPQRLNPRLLLDGLQQIGFSFNASYVGGFNATFQGLSIDPVRLSPKEAEKFDNQRVSITPLYDVDPKGNINGYAQVNFKPFDPLPDESTATSFDREEAIADLHRDDCLVPGFGCVRLRMILETRFQELTPSTVAFDSNRQRTLANQQLKQKTQKNCIQFEVAVDERIPPSIVPNKLLEFLSETLGRVVEVMDQVLEPLTLIGTYLIYACFASNAALFLTIFNEKLSCEFTEFSSKLAGSKWDVDVARIGACEAVYDGTDDGSKDAQRMCKSCQSAMKRTKYFDENIVRKTCDRVACPSAPTWQQHIKNSGNDVDDITGDLKGAEQGPELSKWVYNGKIWAGNDCAVKGKSNEGFGKTGTDYTKLLDMYQFYKEEGTGQSITAKDCKDPMRPAHPSCCGQEYMEQWGTACGINQGSLDTFDEIKESMCLSAQGRGSNTIPTKGGEVQCKSLFNSAAGFCEPDTGAKVPKLVRTRVRYQEVQASAEGNEPYIIISPKTEKVGVPGSSTKKEEKETYNIHLGYVSNKVSFQKRKGAKELTKTSNSGNIATNKNAFLDSSYLNSELDVTLRKDIRDIFYDTSKGVTKPYTKAQGGLLFKAICAEAAVGISGSITNDCKKVLDGSTREEIYRAVLSHIETSGKEYIVKPDEGLLRSAQCVCIPALRSWVARWRQILGLAKTCVDAVQTTGDGSPGACEAFVSQYACDLFYEALTCFAEKYNFQGGGTRIGKQLPFGRVFGALTSSGKEMNRRVTSRYGQTGLFKTLFNDRKLANAICLFAFTGTWNLDVDALIQQGAAAAPIPSQGLIQPCRRRFNGYDINTKPPGLANWVYQFGVVLVPGTDIRYKLELVCSQGFTCRPSDGFKNGECDCNRIGEQRQQIQPEGFGRGILSGGGDPLNVNVFYPINARSAAVNPKLRYDRAILTWTNNDPDLDVPSLEKGEASCSIGLEGLDAPNFCTFDLFTSSYRCQFGFQDSSVAIKTARPDYGGKQHGNQAVFDTQDTQGNFEVEIQQEFPADIQKQQKAIKYLGYTIKNQNLAIVKQVPSSTANILPSEKLEQDGTYTKTLQVLDLFTQENFRATAAKSEEQFVFGVSKRAELADSPFIRIQKTQKVGLLSIIPRQIVLQYSDQGIKVFESTGFIKGRQIGDYGRSVGSQTAKREDKNGKAVYTIELDILRLPKENDLEVLVKIPGGGNALADACKDGSGPAKWTATFNIYDADELGGVTSQISVDAATGKPATKTIQFNALCGQAKIGVVTPVTPTIVAFPLTFSLDDNSNFEFEFIDGKLRVPPGKFDLVISGSKTGEKITVTLPGKPPTKPPLNGGVKLRVPVDLQTSGAIDISYQKKDGTIETKTLEVTIDPNAAFVIAPTPNPTPSPPVLPPAAPSDKFKILIEHTSGGGDIAAKTTGIVTNYELPVRDAYRFLYQAPEVNGQIGISMIGKSGNLLLFENLSTVLSAAKTFDFDVKPNEEYIIIILWKPAGGKPSQSTRVEIKAK